jgi:predicted DsbA family dithiol-disulfide isomerase
MAEWLGGRYGAQITWLPFDLHPEYPPEGVPRADLVARYGPQLQERMKASFERIGLAYAPNPDVVPNSQLALSVTELARDRGLHGAVHDRLMDAYWAEGRDIGDPHVLRELAADAGLDDVDAALEGDAYLDRIAASTAEAHSIGINGIPAFLLDGRLLVLGAQPREVFEQAFSQLAGA